MIELARLSRQANQKFKQVCESYDDNSDGKPLDINDFSTEKLSYSVEIDEHKEFANKFALGQYLYATLKGKDVESGAWHFLVIIYCQQLLNKDHKIGSIERFFIDSAIPYYPFAHLLKPVFDLYCLYHETPELIKFLLLNPVNKSGGLFLETVKRQDLVQNENFIKVSRKLFYDEKNEKIKKGGNSKDIILRLVSLFRQYERAYDLYSMPAEMILKKLLSKHAELKKFKHKQGLLSRVLQRQ